MTTGDAFFGLARLRGAFDALPAGVEIVGADLESGEPAVQLSGRGADPETIRDAIGADGHVERRKDGYAEFEWKGIRFVMYEEGKG